MAILPGLDKSSYGNPYSLLEKAKEQDVGRSIQKDEEYLKAYGVNKVFNELPDEILVYWDAFDNRKAGQYRDQKRNISIVNPQAYEAYLQREENIKDLKRKMEIEEMQRLLEESKKTTSIMFLCLDPLLGE